MKFRSICFCIPGNGKKQTQNEDESEKSSHSSRKSGKRGKSGGDVARTRADDDRREPSYQGAGNSTTTASSDAGAPLVMMSTDHGHMGSMEGSDGSSHGHGGGRDGG